MLNLPKIPSRKTSKKKTVKLGKDNRHDLAPEARNPGRIPSLGRPLIKPKKTQPQYAPRRSPIIPTPISKSEASSRLSELI